MAEHPLGIAVDFSGNREHRLIVDCTPGLHSLEVKQEGLTTNVYISPLDLARFIARVWEGMGNESYSALIQQVIAIRGQQLIKEV